MFKQDRLSSTLLRCLFEPYLFSLSKIFDSLNRDDVNTYKQMNGIEKLEGEIKQTRVKGEIVSLLLLSIIFYFFKETRRRKVWEPSC